MFSRFSSASRRLAPRLLARSFSSSTTQRAAAAPLKRLGVAGRRLAAVAGVAAVGTAAWVQYHPVALAKVDYDAVRKSIAEILDADDYDDGSYGPVLLRLAWHAAGTYDKKTCTGGSDGATMRFSPEKDDGANAGLHVARELMEKIKAEHPEITYADLWSLASVVAIEEMGGPKIAWRPGRSDKPSGDHCPPVGRLPDAAQQEQHVRDVFYRMGFNDQEIVALIGAHALGRCHKDRSGYDGPWTYAPTTFSNEFYRLLLEETWTKKKWDGPEQFENSTGELMMLPADMSLVWDKDFRKWVEIYAKDEQRFFNDFAAAYQKLQELGVKGLDQSQSKGWWSKIFG